MKRWIQRWLGIEEDELPRLRDAVATNDIWSPQPKRGRGRGIPVSDREVDVRVENSVTLIMYPASGGRVVEYKYYDTNQDQTVVKLHLITTDQDLPEALAKILTIEGLRR